MREIGNPQSRLRKVSRAEIRVKKISSIQIANYSFENLRNFLLNAAETIPLNSSSETTLRYTYPQQNLDR